MKKIIGILMMSFACVASAAVAPSEEFQVKRPSVTKMDMTKQKIIRKGKPEELSNTMSVEAVKDLQRYEGVVTMDNVATIERMSRLMQDNPEELMRQLGVTDMNFEIDDRAMGTDEIVDPYVDAPETDDPAERLANVQTPALTGSFADMRASRAELKQKHAEALQKVEQIGRQHLEGKMAPIAMMPTVEDIKATGVDTSKLPEGWEKQIEQSQEQHKKYKKQEEEKKKKEQQTDSSGLNKSSVVVEPAKTTGSSTSNGNRATGSKSRATNRRLTR